MKKIIALSILLCSCVSRETIQAELWMHEAIPEPICQNNPSLKDYGIFRKIKCTKNSKPELCPPGKLTYEEYIPYCSPVIKNYSSANNEKIGEWLKQLTSPKRSR